VLQQGILWGSPAGLTLSSDDIHLFCASLDQPTSRLQHLAETLCGRADEGRAFYFEQDRKHFIIARGLLRTILASYVDIEPSRLQFCYGSYGKPVLAETFAKVKLRFNLSHSQGLPCMLLP